MAVRNHKAIVRLTAEEKKIIETKAKALGMTIPFFLRALGLKGNIITN